MKYLLYNISTGEIEQIFEYPNLDFIPINNNPALGIVTNISNYVSNTTHYVSNGILLEYTDEQKQSKANRIAKYYIWSNSTMSWVDSRTLQEVKQDKRNSILNSWNESRGSGVTIGSKTAPTDPDSWTRYLAIKTMSSEGGWIDVPIPLIDGSFEVLTPAKFSTLWDALKTLERNLLIKLKSKVEAINSAVTISEVNAITWD